MASREEVERATIFAEEDFVVEAQTFLHGLMEDKGLSRAELARAMGVSRARVTQIFSDECKNFTVRLLARAAHALGEAPALARRQREPESEAKGWASLLVCPEDLSAFWHVKDMVDEMRSWVPCNDTAPRKLTNYEYSELEWEAA